MANATDLSDWKAVDHLLPLDGRGVDLYTGYESFVDKVFPKSDYPHSVIFVWPAGIPSRFVAIVQTNDEKSFYLFYALDTKPQPTITRKSIPSDFANGVTENLSKLIAETTRYPSNGSMPILCTDGTEYAFQSNELYARTMCPPQGSTPAKLEAISDEIMNLADLPETASEKRQELMTDVLAKLKALADKG